MLKEVRKSIASGSMFSLPAVGIQHGGDREWHLCGHIHTLLKLWPANRQCYGQVHHFTTDRWRAEKLESRRKEDGYYRGLLWCKSPPPLFIDSQSVIQTIIFSIYYDCFMTEYYIHSHNEVLNAKMGYGLLLYVMRGCTIHNSFWPFHTRTVHSPFAHIYSPFTNIFSLSGTHTFPFHTHILSFDVHIFSFLRRSIRTSQKKQKQKAGARKK